MNLQEYEQLQPNLVADGITFLTPNTHCAWRVETLHTKEPDTIAWIEAMKPGEVLFDVGANIGQYSMYAAIRGIKVHAFEPESQNFALLCRNIAINNMVEKITAWPICLSDRADIDSFYVQSVMPGGSCSSFGEEVNFHLQPKKYAFTQGSVSTTMDAFCDKYGFPTHVKIDVDGLEHKVIAGMGATLCTVKSVLVETNTHLPEHLKIAEIMEDHGLYPDVATAEIARRKDGPFEGVGNIIYYRR